MRSIQAIIDAKFLSLCPAPDAVAWLKEKRQGVPTDTLLLTDDHTYEEEALAGRNDPYIDFGLARYGISEKACRAVFLRGDSDIKTTFLACFPNGGFARIFNQFALAD